MATCAVPPTGAGWATGSVVAGDDATGALLDVSTVEELLGTEFGSARRVIKSAVLPPVGQLWADAAPNMAPSSVPLCPAV